MFHAGSVHLLGFVHTMWRIVAVGYSFFLAFLLLEIRAKEHTLLDGETNFNIGRRFTRLRRDDGTAHQVGPIQGTNDTIRMGHER